MSRPCGVCARKDRVKFVDASLNAGMAATAISAEMAESGWKVSSDVINRHRAHVGPVEPPAEVRRKRDLAAMVAERTADWLEQTVNEAGELVGPDHPRWKDALGPGLTAQQIIDKRESRTDDKKLVILLAGILSGSSTGAGLAPPALIEDGQTVEGEFEEVG